MRQNGCELVYLPIATLIVKGRLCFEGQHIALKYSSSAGSGVVQVVVPITARMLKRLHDYGVMQYDDMLTCLPTCMFTYSHAYMLVCLDVDMIHAYRQGAQLICGEFSTSA